MLALQQAVVLACAGTLSAGLQFHPPVVIGPGSGYACNFEAVSPTVFVGSSLHNYLSRTAGASWDGTASWDGFKGFAGVVGSAFFRVGPTNRTAIRNLGYDLAGVEPSVPCGSAPGVNDSWYKCYSAFSTPWHALYSVDASGKPMYTRVNETTTFTGFPFPVSLRGDAASSSAGEHDFGRDGGGVTVLADGTLVLTADVRWAHDRGTIADAARKEDLTLATNVVALRSTDSGRTFEYTATLCAAAAHRGCGECCNENDVVTLADGKSVMSAWRMGAGDGLIWNKSLGISGSYHFYNHAISTDGGLSFSHEAPLPGMGCAKPELLLVDGESDGSGPQMPVILGGGRKRLMNTSDILLWASAAGDGKHWEEHSVSYWHNLLARPPMPKFTHQINSTKEPRQSSSYVSLLPAGDGAFQVIYEMRATPTLAATLAGDYGHSDGEKDTVFAMRVTVGEGEA